MEPFQLAKYALMQVAALVYAILISGTVVKFSQYALERGYDMPLSYYWALFLKDYGMLLSPLILAWTFWVGYYTFIKSEDEAPWWTQLALIICGLFFIGSTIVAFLTLFRVFA